MDKQNLTKQASLSPKIQWLLCIGCGMLIANIYYGQPILRLIGSSIGLSPESDGLIVTLPLMGYGLGLLLIVPMADLIENRKLVLICVAFEAISLFVFSSLNRQLPLLAAGFNIGLMASSVQILLPYVTYIAPVETRGKAIARVVSGIMLGIMLARPLSSFITDMFGWKAIYRISAILTLLLWMGLRFALPIRKPVAGLKFEKLLGSMWNIFKTTAILRRRAFYHACMFGAFSIFWTAVPIWLSGPVFGLSQKEIAIVALAGVAGSVAPPIAARLVDKGHTRQGTAAAMWMAILSFLLTFAAYRSGSAILVTVSAIILDFAVSANLVFGQRAIFSLGETERSRLNGLFMALFFTGGAIGSALSGWAFARFGWTGVAVLGMTFPFAAFLAFLTEKKRVG